MKQGSEQSEDSRDHVRSIVATEGRVARNLITWSVPAYDNDSETNDGDGSMTRKLSFGSSETESQFGADQKYSELGDDGANESRNWEAGSSLKKRQCYSPNRRSSQSISRNVAAKNKDLCLRARYWSYLLDNLHRAVDEIYYTCDNDESIKECEEVIMMLKNCTRDFKSLITKICLLKDHGKAVKDRRHSLAWEVRKISPCKSASPPTSARRSPSLCSSRQNTDVDNVTESHAADYMCSSCTNSINTYSNVPPKVDGNDPDNEGWEVVTRGRHRQRHLQSNRKCQDHSDRLKEEKRIHPPSPTVEGYRGSNACQPCNPPIIVKDQVQTTAAEKGIEKRPGSKSDCDSPRGSSSNSMIYLGIDREAFDDWAVNAPTGACFLCSGSFEAKEKSDLEVMSIFEGHKNGVPMEMCEDAMASTDFGRTPGKAVELHQKLSSPSRTKPRSELLKISEERMVKAERQRLKLLEEKYCRLKALSERVQRVREIKSGFISSIDVHMQKKMRRAEEKRQNVLKEKVRKAQEEEAKVNEIAFINSLEAQNRKMEVIEKNQILEARLQDIQEERQRKREEQLAKEEAAQERRKALAAERQARLYEIAMKRQEQELKWQREVQERERAREIAAEERRREREFKVMARNIARQTAADELQRKIEIKQLESSKRHEMKIEEVKEKAASYARHVTVEDVASAFQQEKEKRCDVCNVEELSEKQLAGHVRSKIHKKKSKLQAKSDSSQDAVNTAVGQDGVPVPVESVQSKLQKKKMKKYRQKVISRGTSFEESISRTSNVLDVRERTNGIYDEVENITTAITRDSYCAKHLQALEKLSFSLRTHLTTIDNNKQANSKLNKLLKATSDCLWMTATLAESSPLDSRTERHLASILKTLLEVGEMNSYNCWYFFQGRVIASLISIVKQNLKVMDPASVSVRSSFHTCPSFSPVVVLGINAISAVILEATKHQVTSVARNSTCPSDSFNQRAQDIVSHVVSMRLNGLAHFTNNVRSLDESAPMLDDAAAVLQLFVAMVWSVTSIPIVLTKKARAANPLTTYLTDSDLGGIVLLIYTVTHHYSGSAFASFSSGVAPRPRNVVFRCFETINALFLMNLTQTQRILGSETVYQQFRSVASYLVRQLTGTETSDGELLDEVIVAIGFFCLLNHDNQVLLQSGRAPSLLQQLCGSLPFAYFCDRQKQDILLPTLIASCVGNNDNKTILEADVSCHLLCEYAKEFTSPVKREKTLDDVYASGALSSLRISPWLRLPREQVDAALEFFGS